MENEANSRVGHDFSKRAVMTPEEFHVHLKRMIGRIRADVGFSGLSFMNKHQFSVLDDQFEDMWKKYFSGKSLVLGTEVESASLSALAPQTSVSTNSTTRAHNEPNKRV